MTKHKKFKFKGLLKDFKNYLIERHKYLIVYLVFVGLMVLLEALLHLLPVELYESGKEGIKDIDLTDIYYNVSNWRENDKTQQHPHKDVVLINIGDIRNDSLRIVLPTIISHLNKYQPQKIGIDILFEDSRPNDSTLINCLKENKSNIVIAKNKDFALFKGNPDVNTIKQGIINFPETKNRTIRNYYNYGYSKSESKVISSFANLLAGDTLNPENKGESTFYLKYLTSEKGYYNFLKDSSKTDFPAIESSDLLNDNLPKKYKDSLKGKIVIIGFLGSNTMDFDKNNIKDKFKVPMNYDLFDREKTMPGAVIHANAVQILTNQKNYKETFYDVQGILLDIILFTILFLYFLLFEWVEKIKNLLARLTIEISIVILLTLYFIRISAKLMMHGYHLKLDLLLLYLPFLIEFKMFLHELLDEYNHLLFKYNDKLYLMTKKIRKWKRK